VEAGDSKLLSAISPKLFTKTPTGNRLVTSTYVISEGPTKGKALRKYTVTDKVANVIYELKKGL